MTYKGTSLFELLRSDRDGFLGINFDVYGKDGEKVATIRNGRFVDHDPHGYSIDRSHDHFVLTEDATRRKVCEIRLRENASDLAEIEVSAQMYMPDGRLVAFNQEGTNLGGVQMTGCTFERCGSAITIE